MKRKEFEKCCQALEEGEEIFVEDSISHERGKLLYCTGDDFQVKVMERRASWEPERCEEISSSSESPHENL